MRRLDSDGVTESWRAIREEPAGQPIIARHVLPHIQRDRATWTFLQQRVVELSPVRHPLVAGLLGMESVGEDRWILEEDLEGVPLTAILDRVRAGHLLSPPIFLHLATQLCNALDALHARPQPVLHLALSPFAVRVQRDGKVALGDVGLTRAPVLSTRGRAEATRMAWLSPEQTHPDQKLGTSSDLFSVGSLLFEMLTGKVLFGGRSAHETLNRLRRADLGDALSQAKVLLPGVERVLARALSLNPRHRYQRAFVLREDLRGLMAGYSFSRIDQDLQLALAQVVGAVPLTELPAIQSDLAGETTAELLEASLAGGTPPPAPARDLPPASAFEDEIQTQVEPSHEAPKVPLGVAEQTGWLKREHGVAPAGATPVAVKPLPPPVARTPAPRVAERPAPPRPSVPADLEEEPDATDVVEQAPPAPAPVPVPAPLPPPPAAQPPPEEDDEPIAPARPPALAWAAAAVAALALLSCVGAGTLLGGLGGGAASLASLQVAPPEVPALPPSPAPAPAAEVASLAAPAPPAQALAPSGPAAAPRPLPARLPPTTPAAAPAAPAAKAALPAPPPPPVRPAPAPVPLPAPRPVVSAPPAPPPPPAPVRLPPPSSRPEEARVASVRPAPSAPLPSAAPAPDPATLASRATKGQLSPSERSNLGSVPPADADAYTRAQLLLYEDALARKDASAQRKHLAQVLALPQNTYRPELQLERARLALQDGSWQDALDAATRARQHWARLPPHLVASRGALAHEVEALAWTERWYEGGSSQDDAFEEAVRAWQLYEEHAVATGQADLATRAQEALRRLYSQRARGL